MVGAGAQSSKGVDEAGGDVLAGGDAVVLVMGALPQQADRPAVPVDGDEEADVLALRVVGEGVDGLGGVLRQVALRAGRDDDPLDGDRGPVHGVRPGDPPEERLQRRGLRQVLLLDRGERTGSAVGGVIEGVRETGLGLDERGGLDEREDPGVLVPPGRGDVPFRLECGDGQGLGGGDGFGGRVRHGTMLPYALAGALGTVSPP